MHASQEWQVHAKNFTILDDAQIIKSLKHKDNIHVWLRSVFPGWQINAKQGSIKLEFKL